MFLLIVSANQTSADDTAVPAATGMDAISQAAPASSSADRPSEPAAETSRTRLSVKENYPEKGSPRSNIASSMPNHNENGKAFYEGGDYGAAILEFNRQLDSDPNDVAALVNRGLSFAGRGEYKIAIENLYNALSIRKENVTILKYLAALYYLDREFQKSIDMYDRATIAANADFEALAGRGCAYMALGMYKAAIEDFSRTLYIASGDIRAYSGRGISLSATGKQKAAISDFGSALSIYPDNPFIYLSRAESYARIAGFSNALADLNRACALGYTAVCVAVKQAKSDIAGTEGSFVLQYSIKAPDEELYDASRKKLEQFYSRMLSAEINKYFVEMLKPIMN
jgi:tetratricopeptide (TPR) repeat protein